MKHICYAVLGAALLSACAGQSAGTTVASLESLYLAGAAAAQAYEASPGADPKIVAAVKSADNVAFNTLQPLVTAAQGGLTPEVTALAAAQAAISALQAALPGATAPAAGAAQGATK